MSAFLAPIHSRMFAKIQSQEKLIQAIATVAAEKGWMDAAEANGYAHEENRPLADIIDHANIHGWLLGKIEDVEARCASFVTKLIDADASRLEAIKKAAFDFGASNAAEEADAPTLYGALDLILLDGMPCDGACLVLNKSPEHFAWDVRLDVHSAFWTQAGGNPAHFYALREAVISGFLSKTSKEAVTEDGHTYHFATK